MAVMADEGRRNGEDIYVPQADDSDAEAEGAMQMGKGNDNDLRDPWFHTDEGRQWLADRGKC